MHLQELDVRWVKWRAESNAEDTTPIARPRSDFAIAGLVSSGTDVTGGVDPETVEGARTYPNRKIVRASVLGGGLENTVASFGVTARYDRLEVQRNHAGRVSGPRCRSNRPGGRSRARSTKIDASRPSPCLYEYVRPTW